MEGGAGEFLFSIPYPATGLSNFSINIPANIASGYYRIRVRSASKGEYPIEVLSTQACSSLPFGLAQDFLQSIDPYCVPLLSSTCCDVAILSGKWYYLYGLVASPVGTTIAGWTAISG